jgi:hypothetical protein
MNDNFIFFNLLKSNTRYLLILNLKVINKKIMQTATILLNNCHDFNTNIIKN